MLLHFKEDHSSSSQEYFRNIYLPEILTAIQYNKRTKICVGSRVESPETDN